MEAKIIKTDSKSITVQVTIPISADMLDTEEAIQQGVNQASLLATQYADGNSIETDRKK